MPISSASNSPVTSSTNIVNKATSPNAAPSLCNPGLQGVGTIARPERVVYRVNALFTAPLADGPRLMAQRVAPPLVALAIAPASSDRMAYRL